MNYRVNHPPDLDIISYQSTSTSVPTFYLLGYNAVIVGSADLCTGDTSVSPDCLSRIVKTVKSPKPGEL